MKFDAKRYLKKDHQQNLPLELPTPVSGLWMCSKISDVPACGKSI